MVVVGLLALVLGACQVTRECVRDALCEPPVEVPAEPEVPVEPGGLLEPELSGW